MAITNDGGGGSTTQMCSVTPFDQQGQIDNLVSRVEELERIVSEILGANINSEQLSDISQQVGWVYGITYMGVEGWIQTEAGTLIPPAGWTLSGSGLLTDSDGNPYQGVLMDSDGVLQYGFTASGQITGNSAGADDYISLNTIFGTPGDNINLGSISSQRGSAITLTNATTITLNEKGVYAYNLIAPGTSNTVGARQRFVLSQDFGPPFNYLSVSGAWSDVVDSSNDFLVSGVNIGIVTTAPCTVSINWNLVDASDSIGGVFQIVKLQNIV